MAVNINRSKPLISKSNYGFTNREINWIWLNSNKIYKPRTNTYPSFEEISNEVHNLIKINENPEDVISLIKSDIAKYFIEQESIDWIEKDNDRLLIIVINFFFKYPQSVFQIHSNNYNYFINIIDNHNLEKENKLITLNNSKSFWSTIEYKKNIYNWIDKSSPDQIEWAWNYLSKMNNMPFFPTPPMDQKQRYEYILAAIDLLHISKNSDAHELFLIKMKKTWSQKKYRDNNQLKTPHHLPLSKISHGKLKELSEILNRSISGTLELIIEDSYSKHILDDEGKNKY